ncbi:hypothetical protein P691DRAFT_27810 [Macrolepiota fuliginosa MF-IS2]|uniref:Uncharacterized protein n=1 Tax=Macrolepiota fuliginosa MF-IS2 TaxID=1400762 RepID=A0A9P5WXV8_9AGAR|nr:hypothetical protein P691DRAFT_27810 [Macrolepiota fuliginosa MF-IS2]
MHKALLNPDPMYFLLGYDTNTCLVIAYRPAMGIQQFFQDAFRQIRDLHPDDIGSKTEWPTKGDLEVLISASETPQGFLDQAYLPSLARTIVAFVGHPDYADPVGRLRWVMEILNQNHDPMEFLELLHSRSLLDIPRSLHLTTSHVLAFLACYGVRSHSHAIPATFISHFLGLAEASVKQVLRLASLVLSSRPLPFPMDAISNFDLSDLSEYLRGNLVYIQSGGRDEQPSPAVSSQAWLEVSARYIYWCDHVLATDGASTAGGRGKNSTPGGYPTEREKNAEILFRRDVLAGGHWMAFSKATEETAGYLNSMTWLFILVHSSMGCTRYVVKPTRRSFL